MKSPDPGSLQNLNDIVLPSAVGWWPLAIGWYVLIGIFLVVMIWYGYLSLRIWIRNRYRRAALSQLQQLTDAMQDKHKRDSSLRQLPILLKRCALSAYSREQVASLNGDGWYCFLNSQVNDLCFTGSEIGLLDKISYSTTDLNDVDMQAATVLLDAIKHWLKHHKAIIHSKISKET